MRRTLACLAILASTGCSQAPPDYSSGFTGGWVGTTSVTVAGQTTSEENTLMVIASTGLNSLEIEDICTDGSGPPATVTSASAFTVGPGSCSPQAVTGCSAVTLSTTSGGGQLVASTLNLSLNGTLSGCGQSYPFTIGFNGIRAGSTLPDGGTEPDSGSPGEPQPDGGTPEPDGGMMSPAPTLLSVSPSSALSGGPGLTSLAVTGTGFVAGSVIQWNGVAVQSQVVSNVEMHTTAPIPAAELSTPGTASVTVFTPAPGGGTSRAFVFTISATGPGDPVTIVSQSANDLVWDAEHGLIFVSVPSTATGHPNTVSALDPVSGTITASAATGSDPNALAISDDDQFLYVGVNGSATVQRFKLPALTPDVSYGLGSNSSFGPYVALEIHVAPGVPGTSAVSLGSLQVTPAAQGGLVVYDDQTPRPISVPGGLYLVDTFQWGPDATQLFAANFESSSYDFYAMAVDAGGATVIQSYRNELPSPPATPRLHFDPVTNLVYDDDGTAVDPGTGAVKGLFEDYVTRCGRCVAGLMVPDGTKNRAFFVWADGLANDVTVETFNLSQFTPVSSVVLHDVATPRRLIRWGTDGLAFTTETEQIYLLRGSIFDGGT
jgi:hypothetical protein